MSDAGGQILLLIGGAVLGLVLALFAQPLLQDKAEVFLVRFLARFGARKKGSLAGDWMFVWARDGATLDRSVEIPVKLSVVGKRISGRFEWRSRRYWLLAQRTTDEFISGTYIDEQAGLTFHGAFQLRIHANEESMHGRWMGFDSSRKIAEGPWHWRREATAKYPYEFTG
jgi:hypothetical protein